MGHEIAQTTTGNYMTAWSGDTPWHGLGQQASGLMTTAEALEMAHLDWTVRKEPLYAMDEEGNPVRVPDTFGVFRDDEDGNMIPLTRKGKAVGRVWTALQNADAFAFMDEIFQNLEAKIEVCGALGNGERVWILAKMPNSIILDGVDEVQQYILISNTHDGTGSVKILQTPIRVVCNNTLTWALRQGGLGHNIRHTGKMFDKVQEVRETFGLINQEFFEWGEMADDMLNTPMEIEDMRLYWADVLKLKRDEDGRLHKRGENKLKEVEELLYEASNNVGRMSGTLWQAYNIITEAIDHRFTTLKDGKKSLKRQESVLFGELARRKKDAWKLAEQFMQMKDEEDSEAFEEYLVPASDFE